MPDRNLQVDAELFKVGDEVLRGVLAQLARRLGFASATLVEEDDLPLTDSAVDKGWSTGRTTRSGAGAE